MTENERLARQIVKELEYAIGKFNEYEWTAEQLLIRLKIIFKAANLA